MVCLTSLPELVAIDLRPTIFGSKHPMEVAVVSLDKMTANPFPWPI